MISNWMPETLVVVLRHRTFAHRNQILLIYCICVCMCGCVLVTQDHTTITHLPRVICKLLSHLRKDIPGTCQQQCSNGEDNGGGGAQISLGATFETSLLGVIHRDVKAMLVRGTEGRPGRESRRPSQTLTSS